MTLTEWLTQSNWTLMKLAYTLTDVTASYGEDPIYPHRLWRLREGHSKPRDYEVKALLEVTEDEVDSFRKESGV